MLKQISMLDSKIQELENKIKGVDKECPCLVYARITGYYRQTENWNNGKVQEFLERLEYNLGEK